MTRGFPLEPRPGERVDHPHHVGLWFNYGDVNGIDFWNNSDAIPVADRHKMGTIVHRDISIAQGGADRGELVAASDWVMPDGSVALRQQAAYTFSGDQKVRTIDLVITLDRPGQARGADRQQGRRARPARDARARGAERQARGVHRRRGPADDGGVTRQHRRERRLRDKRRREGRRGLGHARRWCTCRGSSGTNRFRSPISRSPEETRATSTYWHARGYGLFAANPLGQKALSNGRDAPNFASSPGTSDVSVSHHDQGPVRPGRRRPCAWAAWSTEVTEASPGSPRSVAR